MHYPKYAPMSKTPDGWIVFSYAQVRAELKKCDCGAQAYFLPNNARPYVKTEYALKLFDKRWDAICAYERQKLAAKHLVAPPVGELVQVRDNANRVKMWGYQTCVAIKIDRDSPNYLKLFPTVDNEWNGPTALRRALRRITLCGLPANDLRNEDLKIPTAIKGKKKYCLGGDLHSCNVAFWSDEHGERPVCIDFGFHCVLQSNRGRIAPVYSRHDC